jgi:hypothetical protein
VPIPEEEKRTIFTDKPSGRMITLKMHLNPHDTFEPLFKKAMKDPETAPQVPKALNEKINEYLTAPADKADPDLHGPDSDTGTLRPVPYLRYQVRVFRA